MNIEPRSRLTIDNVSAGDGKLDVILEMTFSSGDQMTFKMRPPMRIGEGIAALQNRMLEEARDRIVQILALHPGR